MLVAAGQTATYALHGNVVATKKLCSSSSTTPKTNSINNLAGTKLTTRPIINNITADSASSQSATTASSSTALKTLSVRLLKGAVQKTAAFATHTAAAVRGVAKPVTIYTNIHYYNNNNNTKPTSTLTSTSLPTSAPSSSRCTVSTTTTSSKIFVPTATFLKLYTVPPTKIHRDSEERQRTSSTDSLQKEMCHFKPIRSVPTTPWKCSSKSRGASLKIPKATKLNSNCDDSILKLNETQMRITKRQGCDYVHSGPSSVLLDTLLSTHKSAFVRLLSETNVGKMLKNRAQTTTKGRRRARSLKKKTASSATITLKKPTVPVKSQEPATALTEKCVIKKCRIPFVNVAKINLPRRKVNIALKAPLIKTAANKVKTPVPKTAHASITKSKSRVSIKRKPKAKAISVTKLCSSPVRVNAVTKNSSAIKPDAPRIIRKRKPANNSSNETVTGPTKRKSIKQTPKDQKKLPKTPSTKTTTRTGMKRSAAARNPKSNVNVSKIRVQVYTPPLTRSRLRQMTQGQIDTVFDERRHGY